MKYIQDLKSTDFTCIPILHKKTFVQMEDNTDYLLNSCGQTNHTSTRWNCQRAKENLYAFVDNSIHDIEMCSTVLQIASSSIFYSFVGFSGRLQRVPVNDD